jgi:hypothetical protein
VNIWLSQEWTPLRVTGRTIDASERARKRLLDEPADGGVLARRKALP